MQFSENAGPSGMLLFDPLKRASSIGSVPLLIPRFNDPTPIAALLFVNLKFEIPFLVAIKLWSDPIPFRTRPSNTVLPMVVVL